MTFANKHVFHGAHHLTQSVALSHRSVREKIAADSRRKQDAKDDIVRSIHLDNILLGTLASDVRVGNKRRNNVAEQQAQEKLTYDLLLAVSRC